MASVTPTHTSVRRRYSFSQSKLAKGIRVISGYCRTPSDLPYQLRPLDPPSETHLPVLDSTIRLLEKDTTVHAITFRNILQSVYLLHIFLFILFSTCIFFNCLHHSHKVCFIIKMRERNPALLHFRRRFHNHILVRICRAPLSISFHLGVLTLS